MSNLQTNINAADRAERRRRSGVRVGCIWSSLLVLILLIYLGVYFVLQHFNHRNWSQTVSAAIKSGNAREAAAVLERCRQEAPALTEKAVFARWEQQVKNLQEREAERQKIFQQKLIQLEKQLESDNADGLLLNRELAEVARYAADENELARVRDLQLRCEALSRVQSLASVQSSVAELEQLRAMIAELKQLRSGLQFREFAVLQKKCEAQLSDFIRKYQMLPEIADKGIKLRREVRRLGDELAQEKKLLAEAYTLWMRILQSNDIGQAAENCRQLQKLYPQTIYAKQAGELQSALAVFETDFKTPLLRQLQALEQHAADSRNRLLESLQMWQKTDYSSRSCMLILQDEKGRYHHFITYQQKAFVRNGDWATIDFVTIDDRTVKGRFQCSDGRGSVTVGAQTLTGQLAGMLPEGSLMENVNFQLLDDLVVALGKCKIENYPQLLAQFLQTVQRNTLLEEDFKQALLKRLNRAVQLLAMPPEQFIFERNILEVCAGHIPQWCGFITPDSAAGASYRWYLPASCPRDPQTVSLWLVSSDGADHKFTPVGSGQVQSAALHLSDGFKLRQAAGVLAMVPGGLDYTLQLKIWREEAALKNLVMPALPLFLRGK